MNKNSRLAWVDSTKGILMISIIVGHIFSSSDSFIRFYVYSFHVPAFFFISGYLYKHNDSFIPFVFSKFKRIMIPYYFFSLISILVFGLGAVVYPNITNLLECNILKNIKAMLYANSNVLLIKYNQPLWFLPCMFVTFVFTWAVEAVISKISRNALLLRCVAVVIFAAAGHLIRTNMPFQAETAIAMTVWMILGILARDLIEHNKSKIEALLSKYKYVSILFLIAGGVIAFMNSRNVSVRRNIYGNVPIYYISAFLTTIGIIMVAHFISSKRIALIGMETMSILGVHKYPIIFFQELFPLTQPYMDTVDTVSSIMVGLLVLWITLIFSLIVARLLRKYCPLLIGAKRTQ